MQSPSQAQKASERRIPDSYSKGSGLISYSRSPLYLQSLLILRGNQVACYSHPPSVLVPLLPPSPLFRCRITAFLSPLPSQSHSPSACAHLAACCTMLDMVVAVDAWLAVSPCTKLTLVFLAPRPIFRVSPKAAACTVLCGAW